MSKLDNLITRHKYFYSVRLFRYINTSEKRTAVIIIAYGLEKQKQIIITLDQIIICNYGNLYIHKLISNNKGILLIIIKINIFLSCYALPYTNIIEATNFRIFPCIEKKERKRIIKIIIKRKHGFNFRLLFILKKISLSLFFSSLNRSIDRNYVCQSNKQFVFCSRLFDPTNKKTDDDMKKLKYIVKTNRSRIVFIYKIIDFMLYLSIYIEHREKEREN